MKWLRRIALVVVVLGAVLALVPFFVSLSDYVPEVEKALSSRIHEPVSIDSLRAALLPVPHITAEGVAIGREQDIKVSRLTLTPQVWSLFQSQKIIRQVEIEDVTLSQQALGVLLTLAQRDPKAGTVRIESVKLRGAVVKLDQADFGPLDGTVQLRSGEQQGEVTLATRDRAFEAHITPAGERYDIAISAKAWTLPVGPAVRFDTLTVKGTASAVGAEVSEIAGALYGGTFTGTATIGWREGVSLDGQLNVSRVDLKNAAALLSPKARVSGRLDAKPIFRAHARQADGLDEALRVEAPFTVHGGVLHGIDLAGAALALTKQGKAGGETRFDELAGHMIAERDTYRFTQLRIASGGLSARGHVTIAPSKALSGQLNASVKGVGPIASIPLTITGTVDAPAVYPNTSALIGAAAGAAVLGPGLGAAAGAKLGEIADGLFGKNTTPGRSR